MTMSPRISGRLVTRTAYLMLGTDVGFLVYWLLIATHALPASVMFGGYGEAIVIAWNWSFLPLDVLASVTGFAALRALRARQGNAAMLMAVSLSLTATAGGMALAYWAIRGEFQPAWWLPNAYLLLFPLPLLVRLARATPLRGESTVDGRSPCLACARRGKDTPMTAANELRHEHCDGTDATGKRSGASPATSDGTTGSGVRGTDDGVSSRAPV